MSASWVAAAVAGGGLITAVVAVVQFGLLLRDRSAARRRDRQAQAEMVSGWPGATGEDSLELSDGEVVVTLANDSAKVIYGAAVFLVAELGRSPATAEELVRGGDPDSPPYRLLGIGPPGRHVIGVPWTAGGMHVQLGVELAFTDAAGISWIRRISGELEHLPEGPAKHFGLDLTAPRGSP